MKAALLRRDGSIELGEVPDPEPAHGEVLVRVRDCGICGSDLHIARYADRLPEGTILGHEFSGEVAAAGAEGWEIGDRVVALPYSACGRCSACQRGHGMRCGNVRALGLGDLPGAFAEYVRVDSKSLLRIPEGVSFREAALAEPLAVGLRGVRRAREIAGAVCVILGGGPIGLVTLLWAREYGARTIVVADVVAGRRELADRLGADAAADAQREDARAKARALGGRDPDLVFECAGVPGALQAALDAAGVGGEVVVLGACADPERLFGLVGTLKELSVQFVLGYTRGEFEKALEGIRARRPDVTRLITDVVELAELPAVFAALQSPTSQGKVILEFP